MSPVELPRAPTSRLSPMEAIAATDDSLALEVPPAKLLREPLFWAAAAAFVGVVVGMAVTFSMAAWYGDSSSAPTMPPALAHWGGPWGDLLAALSLLSVGALAKLGRRSRALRIGTALLLAWLAVRLVVPFSPLLFPSLWSSKGLHSYLIVESTATALLGSAAVFSLGLGAFFSGARRLGAALLILGVPGELLFFGARYAVTGTTEISGQLLSTTTLLFGAPLGVAEACLFTLLGAMLLGGARDRALRGQAEENRKKALGLYEVGLGKNDPSVVDEVVSKDFRDLGGGVRGKGGMGRIVADLWASYPDLELSVESQDVEGDVVTTRLRISGTDRGSGVMWYPPTGRRVSFEAEFVDRFSGGLLVEHAGRADTEGLLRQLGHHREG